MATLAASLLLAAPDAHAGSYSGPSYSGGTYTNVGPGNTPLPDGINPSTGLYGSVPTPGYYIGGSSGQITAKFTWQPAYAGDPPPASVIVYQHAVAQFSFQAFTKQTASCSDGLGDTEQDTTAGPPSPAIYSGVSSGTRYTVQAPDGSGNVVLKCSPASSFNWSAPGVFTGGASVGYAAAVYPVHITLNGATADSSHNLNILVGQQCEGILYAGPCTLSSFQWTVPGVTFDHFYVSSDQAQGYPVFIDPSVWITGNPLWYWSSSGNYAVSVTAQASMNGQSLGQVTAQQSIVVVTPPQVVTPIAGISSFETTAGTVTGIQAGPPGGAGMLIDSVVTTPNPFAQIDMSLGSYYNIQLYKELRDISSGSFPIPYITNGFVLDNEDPYNGSQNAYEPGAVNPTPLEFSDNPDQGVSGFNGVNIADEFKSYLMYVPPSNGFDVQPVPIHLTQWDWTASAGMSNGVWGPTPPGSCTITSDSPSTEFPSWYASFTNKPGSTGRRPSVDLLSPFDMFSFYKADAFSHNRH